MPNNTYKHLILFTDSYPYGQQETFLAEEFIYLTKEFDRITIYPLYRADKKMRRQELWPGSYCKVETRGPLSRFSLKNKYLLLTRGIFNTSPVYFPESRFFKDKVFCSWKKFWLFMTSLLTIRAILSRKDIIRDIISNLKSADTIYYYWGDRSILLLPYIKKAMMKQSDRFPFVITRFHGSDLYEEAKGYIPFRQQVFKNIDLACPISYNGETYLKTRYPKQLKEIRAFRLGSAKGILKVNTNDETVFNIVSCSNIIPLKRVDIIAKAILSISAQDFNSTAFKKIVWTHFGAGADFAKLKHLTRRQGPEVKINLKGQVSHEEVINFYKNDVCDLFINASTSEGVPVSIMEAISYGIPIIATDVGGVCEIVNEKVGILLPKNTNSDIIKSEIIKFMHLSPEEMVLIRKAALQEWSKNWDLSKNYSEFTEYISHKS